MFVSTEQWLLLVQDSVITSPGKSIFRGSQQLDISTFLLHQIMHKDPHIHMYKIQLTQNTKPSDHGRQGQFADWVLKRLAVDNNFAKQIIFSDKAHFHLSGSVNVQNCWIGGKPSNNARA